MNRKTFPRVLLVSLLIGGLLGAAKPAQAFTLVTEAEAAAARAAPEPVRVKTVPVPDAPRLEVLAPDLANPVPSPTRIQLRFQPTAPEAIRPESFRVRYGALKIDVTKRILAAARVTAEGLDVEGAELPKGQHRLYLEIQDTAGRLGERVLQFSVQ